MIHFHFPASATTCPVCVTLNPPAKPRRTSTALLSRNLPSPIPTDSSFTLSTFTEPGTALTGLPASQPPHGARKGDHRVARLAADVLGERRDVLVDRMQVLPDRGVLVVHDQADDLRGERARVALRSRPP